MYRRLIIFVAIVSLGLPVAPGLATGSSVTFAGKTSQKRKVSFRAAAKSVQWFSFQTRFVCSGRSGFVTRARFARIPRHGRRFSATFAASNGAVRTTITGRISGRHASGTIRRRATFNAARKLDRSGRLVCRSSVRWTARR